MDIVEFLPTNVDEFSLRSERFTKSDCPPVQLLSSLGKLTLQHCSPFPEYSLRRAVRVGGEWTTDMKIVVFAYMIPTEEQDILGIIEKTEGGETVRDYYQLLYAEIPNTVSRLIRQRTEDNADEQWFISRVFNQDLAERFEKTGIGKMSRDLCDLLDELPPEMCCENALSTVDELYYPSRGTTIPLSD